MFHDPPIYLNRLKSLYISTQQNIHPSTTDGIVESFLIELEIIVQLLINITTAKV